MSRKKKDVAMPQSQYEVSILLSALNVAQFEHMELTAEMNQKLSSVRNGYQPALIDFEKQIDQLEQALVKYLKAHAKDFDGPPRSIEFESGTIGFRLGNKRLKPLSKKSWDDVLELFEELEPDYLRHIPEIDREEVLSAALSGELTDLDLTLVGLRVVQDDRPYVETAFSKRVADMAKKD